MKSIRRNTSGCRGVSRCNFGCPHGAKLSVDVSFLPDACAHGALIVTDALVERIDIRGGMARGVRGRLLDDDGVPGAARSRSARSSSSSRAASLHTPLLLRASGVDSQHVGRHMTLHPGVRVGAIFDEGVEGWDGALQSVYSDHFASDGITLVSVYPAAERPRGGVPRRRPAPPRERPQDAEPGRLRRHDPRRGRRPRAAVARARAARDLPHGRGATARGCCAAIEIIARMGFAAGAREIALPIFGIDTLKSVRELDDFVAHPPHMQRVECTAYHPLGTAKMSVDPRAGVVTRDAARPGRWTTCSSPTAASCPRASA